MPNYSESGLTVILPAQDYFRISDCKTWIFSLKGNSLKEMDFGWWDLSTNELYFLELKDFTQLNHPKAKEPTTPESYINKFVTKATDMLILLAGIWLDSSKGNEMFQDLLTTCPNFPNSPRKIHLIFVVKTYDPSAAIWLPLINIEIRKQLKGRVMLFDMDPVDDVVLLDHQEAIQRGLPIQ